MARKKITFDTVREMGLALPDVEEGTVYGSPALKVRGNMFACIAIHRSADPESLAANAPEVSRPATSGPVQPALPSISRKNFSSFPKSFCTENIAFSV